MPLLLALVLAWGVLAGTACGERGTGQEAPSTEAAKAGGQAGPAEKPSSTAEGSVCKEHGVLEAVCTKCNPALIPVFQAKGDWCAEHGFPESFCPICHPERGGKPAVDVKDDGAPADGTRVRFKTQDTARRAGIETARAEERSDAGGVTAVARLTYDASRLALLNARAPGVVQSLKADLGAQVKKGTPLAVILSAAVGADRSRLQAARSRVEVAEADFKRKQLLHQEQAVALKEVQATQQELDAAKAEYSALAASLGMVGGAGDASGTYTLTAPLAGTVIKREASVGVMIDTNQPLYTIADTSMMWADIDLPEGEVAAVAPGQQVVLTFDGLGDREYTGQITYVAPELDPHSRTVLARVQLPNPDGQLRANMFGRARIAVGSTATAVAVPRAAVQRVKDVHLVFVRLKEDEYEARRVTLGNIQEGDQVVLTRGVKPGEEVVTTGSFLLKTETLKGSIGAGCCAVD